MVGLDKHIADIAHGVGPVPLAAALAVLPRARGLKEFLELTGYKPANADVQHEIDLLDDVEPRGWWERVQTMTPGVIFAGILPRWGWGRRTYTDERGVGNAGFSVGLEGAEFVIRTPIMDDEGKLI